MEGGASAGLQGWQRRASCRPPAVVPFLPMGPRRTGAVSGITTGLSLAEAVFTLRWSRSSPLMSLAPSQGRECPDASLPRPPPADPEDTPGRLWCTQREVCAKTGRHTQRGTHAVHTTHTGPDSIAPGTHVGTLGEGCAVIPNTHARTHAHARLGMRIDRETPTVTRPAPLPARAHTGPHRQTLAGLHGHTQTCARTPAAHPPSAQGGGSSAAHMEPRPGWAVLEAACGVGLGHPSQGIVHQLLYVPHPVKTAGTHPPVRFSPPHTPLSPGPVKVLPAPSSVGAVPRGSGGHQKAQALEVHSVGKNSLCPLPKAGPQRIIPILFTPQNRAETGASAPTSRPRK